MKSAFHNFFHRQPPDNPAQPPPLESAATTSPPGGIALQGDIAIVALENIFQFFDFAALSGKLEILTTANSGSFYFRQGMLIHGMLRHHRRKTGEILLASELITPEQLRECLLLQEQVRRQRLFGEILLEKEYIRPPDLDATLYRQIKEAFFETLSWRNGSFLFYHDQLPAPETFQLQVRVDHLLLEGMIHLDDADSPAP